MGKPPFVKLPADDCGQRILLVATQACKPGSVLTAIYLALQLPAGSSRLLETVGQTFVFLHGVAPG